MSPARAVLQGTLGPRLLLGGLAVGFGGLVATQPRVGAVLAAALLTPVLVWTRPGVVLGLLCLTLGLNVDVITSPVFVSLPQLVAMALVAGVLLREWGGATDGRQTGAPARVRPGVLWSGGGVILVAASLPSVPGAAHAPAAVSGILQLGAVGAVLFVTHRWLTAELERVDTVIGALVLGGVLSVGVALVQVVFNVGTDYRTGGLLRAYSTYGQPNSYGQYLVGIIPLALALRHRALRMPAFLLLLIGTLLTGSRGAWVAGAVGLLTFLALLARLRLATVLRGAAVLAVLPLLLLVVPDEFLLSRFQLNDWSTQQRLLILLTAWQGALQSPVLGYGPGSFEHLLGVLALPGLTDDVTHPHNLFLQVWFENGLAAVVALLVLGGAAVVATLRAFLSTRDVRLAALCAALAGMGTASMFSSLFVRGVSELFVVLLGAAGALAVHARTTVPGSEQPGGPSHA